jgi:CopG family nickel-responsive transcriptional regulator
MGVERVGVSFEPELLDKFDSLIFHKGYKSRSEALRDLVRKALIEQRAEMPKGAVIGTITIIYDHDVGTVTDQLLHIQHHHHSEIRSTTHIHLDEHNCLEVLVVKGQSGSIRELADSVKAIKGVKHGELVLTRADL